MNLQGPYRLSGVVLLKRNLLDPVIYVATSATYLLCLIIGRNLSYLSFFGLFLGITWITHRHIESYRSFRVRRKWARTLEGNENFRNVFLASNFPDDYKSHTAMRGRTDSFLWINRIINYIWPYLSHLVHHELNEFLVYSSSLARSKKGFKRFIYAIVRQLDANILAIEHCELGARAPFIRNLVVSEEDIQNKSIIYDLDFAYEGNMNMSFICRYCCCCSSRMGFKDVFVHLQSRLVVGPIEEEKPSIGSIKLSLLELPTFGYKGIAIVELAELKLARRSINRLIKDHLLHPKQICIELERKKRDESKKMATCSQDAVELPHGTNNLETGQPPFMTRLLAGLTYFTCICSNTCLHACCQQERLNRSERRHQDD